MGGKAHKKYFFRARDNTWPPNVRLKWCAPYKPLNTCRFFSSTAVVPLLGAKTIFCSTPESVVTGLPQVQLLTSQVKQAETAQCCTHSLLSPRPVPAWHTWVLRRVPTREKAQSTFNFISGPHLKQLHWIHKYQVDLFTGVLDKYQVMIKVQVICVS